MACKVKKKKLKKKSLSSLLLISFFLILFTSLISAYTLIDGNVIYENNQGKLNVFPAIAQPITPNGNIYEQTFIAEKKIAGTHDLRLAYIFNEQLEHGKIWQLVDGEWVNRTSLMTHTIQNGKHIYYTPEIEFSDATPVYTWKINYTPAENDLSKKWELYAWNDDFNVLLDPWWNPDWDYNRTINITTTTSVLDQNFTAMINLDTQILIATGKMQADCDDLRIVFQDTIDLNRNVIACNSIDTNVFFRLQNVIPITTTDSNYSIYYGNTITINPPDNNALVYRIGENFDNLDNWTKTWNNGIGEIQSNTLHLAGDSGAGFGGYCWTGDGNTFKNFVLELDVNGSFDAAQTSQILLDYNGVTAADTAHDFNASTFQQYKNNQIIAYAQPTAPVEQVELYTQGTGINWTNSDWNHIKLEYYGDKNTTYHWQDNRLIGTGTDTNGASRDPGTICFNVSTIGTGNDIFIRHVQLRETVDAMPTITLSGETLGIFLRIQYYDINGSGSKPDSWVIKGTDYVSYCDSNGSCYIPDLNGWITQQYSIFANKIGADQNILQPVFGSAFGFDGIGELTTRRTTITLINEDTGVAWNPPGDFNADDDSHIVNVIMYDINGGFLYDFNASGNYYSIEVPDTETAYNFEITYNNAGLEVKYKKEINLSLIDDTNSRICVAPLQNFFEQIFTSTKEKQIIVYLPISDCHTLAGNLRNIYQEGQFNNVYTINKTYQAYTFDSDGTQTFLAWVNGGSEYSHNLDAIEINKEEINIVAGYDTLAFVPLIDSSGIDLNILQIYFLSYHGNYINTNLKIYDDSNTLLFETTEDINANEFVLNWDWSAYGFTDENLLQIVIVSSLGDGTTKTFIEYFNIHGNEFVESKDPTFIAIMTILFFLFGITLTSVGRTFGWFGIVICIASMAISVMALPGAFFIPLIQAGLFICFLFIFLNGGATKPVVRGLG